MSPVRRLLGRALTAAGGAAAMMTLMACYGLPPCDSDDAECLANHQAYDECLDYDSYLGNCCDAYGYDPYGRECCDLRDAYTGACCDYGLDASGSCKGVNQEECGDGYLAIDEECDDGNVLDGDGCSSQCELEGLCIGAASLPLGTTYGATTELLSSYYTQCFDGFQGAGSEQVYTFMAPAAGTLKLSLQSADSYGLYVAYECQSPGLVTGAFTPAGVADTCAGPGEVGPTSLQVPVSEDPMFVIVDSVTPGVPGAFELEAEFELACGNGITSAWAAEQCDDGNLESGDGCSSDCNIEYDVYCQQATELSLGTTAGDTTTSPSIANGPGCGGRENMYVFTPEQDGVLTIVLDSVADLTLAVSSVCDAATLQSGSCLNEQPAGVPEVEALLVSAGQPLFVRVDGATSTDAGEYSLQLQLQ